MKSVYSAVRTGSLNQTDKVWSLKGYNIQVEYCLEIVFKLPHETSIGAICS